MKFPRDNIVAPVAENNRLKVLWTDSGIADYQSLVGPQLQRIQRQWLSSTSRTSVSLLLESTNNILATSAAMTNDTIALNRPPRSNKSRVPKPIRISKNALLRQNKRLKRALCSCPPLPLDKLAALESAYREARTAHRKIVRHHKANESIKRDELLYSIQSSNPSSIFSSLKRSKRSKAEEKKPDCW